MAAHTQGSREVNKMGGFVGCRGWRGFCVCRHGRDGRRDGRWCDGVSSHVPVSRRIIECAVVFTVAAGAGHRRHRRCRKHRRSLNRAVSIPVGIKPGAPVALHGHAEMPRRGRRSAPIQWPHCCRCKVSRQAARRRNRCLQKSTPMATARSASRNSRMHLAAPASARRPPTRCSRSSTPMMTVRSVPSELASAKPAHGHQHHHMHGGGAAQGSGGQNCKQLVFIVVQRGWNDHADHDQPGWFDDHDHHLCRRQRGGDDDAGRCAEWRWSHGHHERSKQLPSGPAADPAAGPTGGVGKLHTVVFRRKFQFLRWSRVAQRLQQMRQ